MIQQVGNALLTMMFAKFMLNDVPHAIGLENESWVDRGLSELHLSLRGAVPPSDMPYIDEYFNSGKLKPIVESTLKKYIVGYYLIATSRHDSTTVDKTYRAIKSIWRVFKVWISTGKLEREVEKEDAEFMRGDIEEAISDIDKGILLTDAGGSKAEFIDMFASTEHTTLSLVVHGFISTYQDVPPQFEASLWDYYYARAEMLN